MVFVLDSNKQPLDPCHPARARELLRRGRAAVFKRYPFTIILKGRQGGHISSHRLKLDPGSKTTGLALLSERTGRVVFAAELSHRSHGIHKTLLERLAKRRSRRSRHTRYRPARFLNRRRPNGWLTPCMRHRVQTTLTWADRLQRLCPISALSIELVRFDTQLMENAEISGVEYQQGELAGYEVREYLLEKWGRKCAYCGKQAVPLQIEHLIPRIRGGSNRVSNLTLACEGCNLAKGNRTAAEFGYERLMELAKAPLRDVAGVMTTRWALYHGLSRFSLPLEVGTGGRTKWNRTRLGLSKSHWADAACVGASTPDSLDAAVGSVLLIASKGHGSRQMCGTDKHGLPIRHKRRQKRYFGFITGDLVRAVVRHGKRHGTHVGRVLVRASGSFDVTTKAGRQGGIGYRYCTIVQRADGYTYGLKPLKRGRSSQA